jgi:hypothetical protein
VKSVLSTNIKSFFKPAVATGKGGKEKEKEKEKEGKKSTGKTMPVATGKWVASGSGGEGGMKGNAARVPVPNRSHHVLRQGLVNTFDPAHPWVDHPPLPTVQLRFLGLLAIGRAGQTALNLGDISDRVEEKYRIPPKKVVAAASDGASNMLAPNGLSQHKKENSDGAVVGLFSHLLLLILLLCSHLSPV